MGEQITLGFKLQLGHCEGPFNMHQTGTSKHLPVNYKPHKSALFPIFNRTFKTERATKDTCSTWLFSCDQSCHHGEIYKTTLSLWSFWGHVA